jgi:MerR family transcriptional regulator, Zn(II)-responsive regulator of zntA
MKNETPVILVGQLSKMTNKTPRALRMYEELGLLCPSGRTSSGYRRYDQKSIDQVRYIEQLQLMGLSLTEIQKWVQDFRTKVEKESSGRDIMFILRELYAQKQIELQQKITDLQRINEQLQSATHFLDGCSSCSQKDVPTACISCKEQQVHTFKSSNITHNSTSHTQQKSSTQKVPELVGGMLAMIQSLS